MSIVVYCKISRQDYDALAIKDEDTLYAVNDNGDFSDANLNDEAELYLGNKRLTPEIVGTTGQSTTAVMSQKATTDAINNFVLPYGECSTAGATAAKVVTTSEGTFTLKRGARVMVKFINTHTASSMTLNVNGTGAKGVYWNGVAVDANKVFANTAYEFVYDGTYYRITGIATYNNATTSAAGLMSSADKTKLDGLGKKLTINEIEYNGTSDKSIETSYYTPKYITSSDASTTYRKLLSVVPTGTQYGDTHLEFTVMGRNNVKCEVSVFIRTIANKKYVSSVNVNSFGTLGMITAYKYTDSTTETDTVEIWLKIPSYDTIKIFPKTYYSYAYISYTWDSNTSYSSLPTNYTSKIDVIEGFRTYGLEVIGGNVKLANFSNGKIHGHQSSQAIGNYSTALGYNSRTQVPTGDSSLPYGYIASVSPLSFTIVDDTLYGVSLAKNDRTTYTYNGVNYTVTNPNATYHASVFLIKDSDNTLLKGTSSYPNNVCIIAKSSVTVGTGRILAVKNIVDDVYEIIVNQQNTTLQSYTSALTLYVFKKSNSSNYNGAYSVASGYYSVASGAYSVASGYSSVASGAYSVASGSYSVASGAYSVASGNYSVASGNYSVASGTASVASGYSSVTSGYSSVASGNYSVALGYYTNASTYQTVVGRYNSNASNAYFIVGNGSSETARSNAMTVNTDGTTNIAGNLLPMTTNTKSLGSTSLKWANVYATTFNGNATSATKVNKALTIKQGSTTDTYDGSAAKTIDITKLNDIGTLSELQTSNKTTIVDAINEVNTKANQSGGGTIGDSTISPFAGYLPSGVTVIEDSASSTEGDVLYDAANNRFVFRDKSGTFVRYYGNWSTSYLYNNTSGTSATCRTDKLFSYNDQHYMVINGSLQDISNIESVLKSYSDNNKTIAIEAANDIATSKANSALIEAKNYTDNQIEAKIQLVSALPSNPTAGVLYLIPDE